MASSERLHTMDTTGTAAFSDTTHLPDNVSNEPNPKRAVPASTSSGLSSPPIGPWRKIHWGLLLVALAILVVAGQGQHFFFDEWAFIGGKLDALPFADRYLLPHNEHWSMLPVLAYRTLRATVGVGSYWPYLGLLLLLHLGVTHVLWRLMLVTGSKPIVATALAAVFSVLGAGAEDLLWAFQIGFVGSTLLGVGAVCLAVTGTGSWRRIGVIAFLITASFATSGVGLAYLIVVPLVLAQRVRRNVVLIFCLPLLIYVGWYATYGSSLTHAARATATLPLLVGAFIVVGLAAVMTRYFGFPDNLTYFLVVGVPILAGLALACRDWWTDRTLALRTPVAMSAGAVIFFGTVGLARAGLGLGSATSSRYIYVAGALLLPAIALLISRGVDRHPQLMKAVVPVAIVIATSNTFQLFSYAAETRHDNDTSRRVLVAAADLGRSSGRIFADQLPEPHLAPDLTTADLASGHLDAAFEGVRPGPLDRLTASLNLQIRVAPVRGVDKPSTCRNSLTARITVPASRSTTPTFFLSAGAPVELTLHVKELQSTMHLIDLAKGTYVINSLRGDGELTIESNAPGALLANC